MKSPKLLGQILGADGDLPAQIAMRMAAGKRRRVHFLAHGAQRATKVFSSMGSSTRISRMAMPACAEGGFHQRAARLGIGHDHVQAIAEPLHVDDHAVLRPR